MVSCAAQRFAVLEASDASMMGNISCRILSVLLVMVSRRRHSFAAVIDLSKGPGTSTSDSMFARRALCALLLLWPWSVSARSLLPGITSRVTETKMERPADIPTDEQLEKAGAVIGKITLKIDNIFDTESPEESATLFRLANRLHIKTRESTIRERLLIHPGDRFRARRLAESERILRASPQLDDVSIRPVRYHDGVVDLEVSTRDIWTLNPGISFGRAGGRNTGGIELEERNLLGLGSELRLTYKKEIDRDLVNFHFEDPNIGGDWWKLKLDYKSKSDGNGGGIALSRPFFSLDTRHAWGGSFLQDRHTEYRYDLGKIVDQYAVDQRQASLFFGWSDGVVDGWVTRWETGIALDRRDFTKEEGTVQLPESRNLLYPRVSWTLVQERFLKERNRDQIRRTEDVDLGWHLNASLGYATSGLGADRDAWLISASGNKGLLLSPRQTLLTKASVEGRLEHGHGRNVLLGGSLRYYFRQSMHRLSYLSLSSDYAIEQDADQQLLLGGDNGLRGYPLRYQGGAGRWLLTLEQRFYTNWYPFRLFNVGAAVFADAGATWGDNPGGTRSQGVLRDLGFGLRLGNSRSALGNVVHVDFAFPLDGGDDISRFQFLVQTRRSF